MEERNMGTNGQSPDQGPTSVKDISTELPERCKSPYHRLD